MKTLAEMVNKNQSKIAQKLGTLKTHLFMYFSLGWVFALEGFPLVAESGATLQLQCGLLIAVAFFVVEHGLQLRGFQ